MLILATGAAAILLNSCSLNDMDRVEPLLYGGGAYGIADALQDDDAVSAAAGAGGFLLSNSMQKRRNKLVDQELVDAKSDGKQLVMLEMLETKYNSQVGLGNGADVYEVSVPFSGYRTSDGVELEAHEKVILIR